MLEKFLHDNFSLFDKKKLIVAVSGGLDSMVLTHLLIKSNAKVAVAHINHHTREGMSTHDTSFVKRYCHQNNLEYFCTDFHHQSGNFQEKAREFRYAFFNEVSKSISGDYIVTAHHHDDAIESFLIHAMRGTGIRGLRGILHVDGNRLRPLINFTRKEIEHYATEHSVPYVQDESNTSSDYSRNKIRNEIMPLLSDIFPALHQSSMTTLRNITNEFDLLTMLAKDKILQHSTIEHAKIFIDLTAIINSPDLPTLLYHYLSPFGFSFQQVEDSITSSTGSLFTTESHIINKDRNRLILSEINDINPVSFSIPKAGLTINFFDQKIEIGPVGSFQDLKPSDILLDTQKLVFPLELRDWKEGDTFQPAGMEGHSKKIAKLLKDLKIPVIDKPKVLVLTSEGLICCIPGIRADERYLARSSSNNVLVVRHILS